MEKSKITKLTKNFEEYSYEKEGLEFWFARDLQSLLGYSKWENFSKVVDKAKDACKNSGNDIFDHFPDVRKTINMPKGAKREIEDVMLTRYACYLIAQNGDPRKDEIAFAQSYFAVQTRKQELIEKRVALIERLNARQKLVASEIELSKLIYERGVDGEGFARIRSKGDKALFGGFNTMQIKRKIGIPIKRAIVDFLPTVIIAAKNFATELTNFNLKQENLEGENYITKEHVKNNLDVRNVMISNNIVPENLPPEEDIKKLAKKVKNDEKSLASSKNLKKKKVS